MVRVLVSTAIRESMPQAAACVGENGQDCAALVHLCALRNRRATAIPAPAVGLCFTGAGYET